jgi:hypothetical protein
MVATISQPMIWLSKIAAMMILRTLTNMTIPFKVNKNFAFQASLRLENK